MEAKAKAESKEIKSTAAAISSKPSDIEKAVNEVATKIGASPSREWHDYAERRGVAALRRWGDIISERRDLRSKGGFLTAKCKGGELPPPPPPPKVRCFTAEDWELCRERCANCGETGCRAGVKVPPDKAEPPRPPEDCPHFVSL